MAMKLSVFFFVMHLSLLDGGRQCTFRTARKCLHTVSNWEH